MSRLQLYFAPGTCALAVHIALTEAQAGYIGVSVDGPFKPDTYKY